MGQKGSCNNTQRVNSQNARESFKQMKAEIEQLRKELLEAYNLKADNFNSAGEDICTFIDILHLFKEQRTEMEYKNYLNKIAQYIGLTINTKEQLSKILQSTPISNEQTSTSIKNFISKLQDSSQIRYSVEYLFQLGQELEELNEDQLSTCYSM